MSTVLDELTADGTSVDSGEEISARDTIRRGLAFSPELGDGFGWTLLLAAVGTAGRLVVPISMQQTLDRGINGPGGVDVSFVVSMAMLAAVAIIATGISSYFMTARLFTASERGLSTLRIKAFRHVHDLPLLTQNTEHRGALVSRVTSDVDQVSQFLVFGGVFGIISVGQAERNDRLPIRNDCDQTHRRPDDQGDSRRGEPRTKGDAARSRPYFNACWRRGRVAHATAARKTI